MSQPANPLPLNAGAADPSAKTDDKVSGTGILGRVHDIATTGLVVSAVLLGATALLGGIGLWYLSKPLPDHEMEPVPSMR